jgi:hypothetical protein
MHVRLASLTLALGAAAACGYTDAGGGSRTLEVIATMDYQVHDNETTINIEVNKDGAPLEGANVVVKDDENGTTHEIAQQNAGADTVYRQNLSGYIRRAELRVELDNDRLDAKLEGPGPHRITEPENGRTFKRSDIGDNLTVKWKTDDGIAADETTIRLGWGDRHSSTIKEDPGNYDIPSASLADGNEEVRVIRRNRVNLDGGIGQSKLEISYEARNDIIIQ